MIPRILSAGGWMVAFGLMAAVAVAQEAAPELPVAEWSRGGAVSLEDFRGQVTAVVFYDDNSS